MKSKLGSTYVRSSQVFSWNLNSSICDSPRITSSYISELKIVTWKLFEVTGIKENVPVLKKILGIPD